MKGPWCEGGGKRVPSQWNEKNIKRFRCPNCGQLLYPRVSLSPKDDGGSANFPPHRVKKVKPRMPSRKEKKRK